MLRITVVNPWQRVQVTQLTGEIWLGRKLEPDRMTVVIHDPTVSRRQMRVQHGQGESDVVIENVGNTVIRFADSVTLQHNDVRRQTLPVTVTIGKTTVEITRCDEFRASPSDQLETETSRRIADVEGTPSPEVLAKWFAALLEVHRSPAGSAAFYDETARAVVELVGLDRGLVLLRDGDEWKPKGYCTVRGDDEIRYSTSVIQEVLDKRSTFYDLPSAKLVTSSLQNIDAVVASPIFDEQSSIIGVVYGSRDMAGFGGAIRPLEAQFVQLLASAVGGGLTRLEQQRQLLAYENELAIGRRIQTGFLPDELPQIAGWEIAACFRPAREVSGDFYDVFALPGSDKLILAVADVCDKGVGAALFMAVVRTLIRAFSTSQLRDGSLTLDLGVQSIVELVHRYVLTNHSETGMFATLFLGGLDTATGELAYVNAGHEAPFLLRHREITTRLEATGPGIGLFEGSVFRPSSCILVPGDMFFAYTDGITEARNADGEFYGAERLREVLCQLESNVQEIVFRLEESVSQHLAGETQSDDITALAIQMTP